MSKEKDILLIRKYLKGELDGRAMHDLERRALDDPFLADALEGFEQTGSDQQANLDDIARRLQQHTNKKEQRIIPWGPLSIAASILVIIGAAIWFLSGNQQPENATRLAQEVKVEKKEQPVISSPSPQSPVTAGTNSNPVKQKQAIPSKSYSDKNAAANTEHLAVVEMKKAPVVSVPPASAEVQAEAFYKPKKDSVGANELVVKGMEQKKPIGNVLKEVQIAKDKKPAATESLLQSRVEGVSVTPENRTVTGVVMGSDGQPITGATVKIVGRPFGVVTDVNGKFVLSEVSKNQTLAVNYIGYNSKKVKVSNQDSLNISLQPASSSLNEVVVTGYGAKKGDTEAAAVDAHPQDGWHAYNEYLKKNAQSPDGKTGKVKLSFVVAADGSLSQFKIIKSLSDAADKKAIDLVTDGPAWVGGTDRKPKEIKVSVSFK